jgi:hypothetical protein
VLFNTYWHIVGRLSDVVSNNPRCLELIPDNTARFISHLTDCVLNANQVIEEDWKPKYLAGVCPRLDVGKLVFDFLESRQIERHKLPALLSDLYTAVNSALYDVRDWKIYGNPFGPHRLAAGG